jgi:quinol monooxygenase YgiN
MEAAATARVVDGPRYRIAVSAFTCQTWRVTRSHLHLRAKPGKRDALLEALDRLEVFAAVREQPGFLAAQIFVPEDDADTVLVEGSWSSPEHYDRWDGSSARTGMLRDVRHLLAEEPEARVYHMVDAIS